MPREPSVLWVVDFPLFEPSGEGASSPDSAPVAKGLGALKATHHPFTAPIPDDLATVLDPEATRADLLGVKGQHYDIVLSS